MESGRKDIFEQQLLAGLPAAQFHLQTVCRKYNQQTTDLEIFISRALGRSQSQAKVCQSLRAKRALSACPASNICTPPAHWIKADYPLSAHVQGNFSLTTPQGPMPVGPAVYRIFDEFCRILGSTAGCAAAILGAAGKRCSSPHLWENALSKGDSGGSWTLMKFGLTSDESTMG